MTRTRSLSFSSDRGTFLRANPLRSVRVILLGIAACLLAASSADATYNDLMGFPELQAQLGGSIPTGSSIEVQHVEAEVANGTSAGHYFPASGEFSGKALTNETVIAGATTADTGISPHASTAGRNFYGNTNSIAPGISTIKVFEANHWLTSGFLRRGSSGAPLMTTTRVSNHSWVGSYQNASDTVEALQRTDFVVEQDDFIVVAGVPNGGGTNQPLLKDAYNEISVGLTNGNHREGTIALDATYVAGRTAPDLVTPGFRFDNNFQATSWATPMVSAGAALLLETGQMAALSNGTITNRTRTINHAETSEVIKAVLMAGTDRYLTGFRDPAFTDLTDYTIDTTNNLDLDYGAGQMNIFNSYNILAAGEQDSIEDGLTVAIGDRGWDYDPSFGGAGLSNSNGTYRFIAANTGDLLQSTLAWNAQVDIAGTLLTTTVNDFNLALVDVTNPLSETVVQSSNSALHNTENLYFDGLIAGNTYELRVTSTSMVDWDYALAWQITGVPEPSTLLLAACVFAALPYRRRQGNYCQR